MLRHAVFAQVLIVAAYVRGAGPYPELGVRKQWHQYICYNQGARVFGERYSNNSRNFGNNDADAFGDINGDRKLDAIKEQGVFLGHGDGIFGTLTAAFVNGGSMALASADLNEDGYDDVLMGIRGIRVFFGNPDGTLTDWGYAGLSFSYELGGLLTLVDLDGDGFEDLLAEDLIANGQEIGYGRGDGTFTDVPISPIYGGPSTKFADFNGDGFKDLVTPRRPSGLGDDKFVTLLIALGKEKALQEPYQTIRVDIPEYDPRNSWTCQLAVATGDVDGDGKEDILTGGGSGRLGVFLGRGDGTFGDQENEPLPVQDFVTALLFEDFDLDGLEDLVVGYIFHSTYVYWGLEEGFVDFASPTEIPAVFPTELTAVRGLRRAFIRGDANDDGTVDLADAIAILEQLFMGRRVTCGDASDVNDSSLVDITDAVFLLNHMFLGGPSPPYPYPGQGGDETVDVGIPPWRGQGAWGDLGCSPESFYYFQEGHSPCMPDEDPVDCPPRHPPLQIIDVGVH